MERLLSFVKRHQWQYVKGIVLLLFINMLQLAVPRITGNVIDKIQRNTLRESRLLMYSCIIIVISLLILALHYLSRVHLIGAANLFEFETRNALFQHLEKLSMRFFDRKSVGELMALSVNDLGAVRMAMMRGTIMVVNTFFLLVSCIVILSRTIDVNLTLMAFAPFPILILVMIKFGNIIHQRFKAVQQSFADLTRRAQENISGIRIIKAFAQEDAEVLRFQKLNEKNYEINMQLVKMQGMFFPLIHFVASLSFLTVLVYGGTLVIRREITLGDFIAFNSYVGLMIRPIGFIGMIITFIQRGKASFERIEELFHEKPDVDDEAKRWKYFEEKVSVKLQGKIEFRNLTFTYDHSQKPVLENISLSIEAGKTVGIIGRVGSGKSTLANLLLRMYNPNQRGQLLVDGKDIMDIPLMTLRNSIGYVPQDNFLFSSTIRSNIGFIPREVSMKELEEAAKISQILDTIMEFPGKFETMLGEKGVNLSGGQKQRISIARAFIKNPSILILDDCLSAVDTNTEKKIVEKLKEVMKNRTCIMIAHRISTIQHADEIVVLNNGRVAEKGTHQQLLDQKGMYYRMYQRQLLEEEISLCQDSD